MNESDKMKKAYSASWKLMKAKMRADKRIEDVEALESIEKSDVIIAKGSYDFIEQVFDSVGLPYTLISMSNLAQFKLDPKQSLLINCPGIIENDSEKIIENIRSFVRKQQSHLKAKKRKFSLGVWVFQAKQGMWPDALKKHSAITMIKERVLKKI